MASKTKAEAELRERIRGEGALAAYEAMLAVCRDKTATPQARATAGASIFRAAGFFEKTPDPQKLEDHELTYEQLQQRLDTLREARLAGVGNDLDQDGLPSVFD